MKWGLTKEIKNIKGTYEEKGWIYIRYFWKKVYNLFKSIDPETFKSACVNADYIEVALDKANEVAKAYFKGEKDLTELRKALESCYQAFLKLYNFIKINSKATNQKK